MSFGGGSGIPSIVVYLGSKRSVAYLTSQVAQRKSHGRAVVPIVKTRKRLFTLSFYKSYELFVQPRRTLAGWQNKY